ncbi:MAG: GDP-L-fucose synthase [Gammaproteobacteria bacterium]
MHQDQRVFVAGHRGLVGSALVRELTRQGYHNLLLRTHAELDLTDRGAVERLFEAERPAHVFLAAARVGGIHANDTYPADFIRDNLLIQTNVIDAAWRHGVQKLMFLGSSCIYPKHAPQPMREEHLLGGPLEPTNEAYAIAKIAGIKMCAAYNRQYGTDYLCVMPTNLYGPGDSYDLQNSHVLPALIRKMHEAREAGAAEVEIWGSGSPRREFLHSDDLAAACVFLMQRCTAQDLGEIVNIGTGRDIPIAELARLVADIVGFAGELRFNTDYPDGTPRKLLDVSRLHALGWQARIELRDGIAATYRDWLDAGTPS